MTFWDFVGIVFIAGIVLEPNMCIQFNSNCECIKERVKCSGRNLTYIPEIPKNSRVFEMNGTGLVFIGKNGLDNISTNDKNHI